MTKITTVFAIVFALCAGSVSVSAQSADPGGLKDAFTQLRAENNEHRAVTEAHTKKIVQLEQKVAGNQSTPSAAAPAPGKIDYTRYDRLVRDCVGVWTPDPTKRDEEAGKLNDKLEIEFVKSQQYCFRKQTEQAARQEDEKRRALQSRQVAPSPAPGAIRDDEPVAANANYNDDRDGPAVVQQASYGRHGRRQGGLPPMSPEKRRQFNEFMGERALEVLNPTGNYRGFEGASNGPKPVPAGCKETHVHDPATRGTFVIKDCHGNRR
jgi:hypothetical protein